MSTSGDGDCSVFSEELIWEILKWIPVKPLMRLKRVCKLWLSIILNPSFARTYQGGFKGLLLTGHESREYTNRDFYYLMLMDGDNDGGLSAFISNHHTMDLPLVRGTRSTGPVNGLVCLYHGEFSCLYNIATRESLVLPVPMLRFNSCEYYLGFDPSNKLYKVLKTSPIYRRGLGLSFLHNLDSEILTIGVDWSWRRIDPAPWELRSLGYCKDGVLYWDEEGTRTMKTGRHLLSFDLAREKFELVDKPEEKVYCALLSGPKIALVSYYRPPIHTKLITLLCYNDDHLVGNGKQASLSMGNWTKHEFDASTSEELSSFRAVSTLPNGNVILIHKFAWRWNSLVPVPFYIYHQTKMELKKCFISQCPSPSIVQRHIDDRHRFFNASYYEENITRLRSLGSRV
ncbi:OLC1v1019036C1 [Oldenlandia corymbosa var. corymbosa]|uniref:OLC1v1019036C1 n=1 Tax=Oldenlandia corymbosa var. corymbosa TaxID=529605 RepID=A0AAV1ED10_OLDCO|nr:OLC1v1019036C1 [Oldenlandia corymbosa var. corymbosa]